MEIFYYIIAFFMGGAFQSAASCLNYRIRHGMDWVHGHSVCEGCGKQLRWWELIPVVSGLLLKGRCPRCGYYFGFDASMLEATGGAMAVLLCLGREPDRMLLNVCIFGILLVVVYGIQGRLDRKK